MFWDKPGGCSVYRSGGVRHRGGVSPDCGFRVEQEKAGRDTVRVLWGLARGRVLRCGGMARSGRTHLVAWGVRVPWRDLPADRLVVVMKPL